MKGPFNMVLEDIHVFLALYGIAHAEPAGHGDNDGEEKDQKKGYGEFVSK
jgi:hypothetical protein